MAAHILEPESVEAIRTVQDILRKVDDHGVIDVFAKYRNRDVLLSIFALSRLQQVTQWTASEEHAVEVNDPELVEELLHYIRYAAAAYGWKMNMIFGKGRRIGNQRVIRLMTSIEEADLLAFEWKSRSYRPAYFVARDLRKKSIVVCIRGTWSASDILTDLCCTYDEFKIPRTRYFSGRWASEETILVHHGMAAATKLLKIEIEDVVMRALRENPGFRLIIVGHSMGGSVAALLGALWQATFPKVKVYSFGPACVATGDSSLIGNPHIVSVVLDGDPFRTLSLGHLADISAAIASLCEDPHLRSSVLMRTNADQNSMSSGDLKWSIKTMTKLEETMTGSKLFPPGRIVKIKEVSNPSAKRSFTLEEVSINNFKQVAISHKMFDLSRHNPASYELALSQC